MDCQTVVSRVAPWVDLKVDLSVDYWVEQRAAWWAARLEWPLAGDSVASKAVQMVVKRAVMMAGYLAVAMVHLSADYWVAQRVVRWVECLEWLRVVH